MTTQTLHPTASKPFHQPTARRRSHRASGSARRSRRFDGPHRVSALAMIVLMIGVVLAASTTRDPVWWHQHYSQLGTFDDFSGYVFNGTLMVTGMLLAAYGLVMPVGMRADVGRRTATALRISIAAVGAHLVILGMIPLSVDSDAHGIAAAGLAVSLVSLMCSGLGVRGLRRAMRRGMIIAATVLVLGAASMLLTVITPWTFETIAFVAMASWVVVIPGVVRQPAPTPAASVASTEVVVRTVDDDASVDAADDRAVADTETLRLASVPMRAFARPIRPAPQSRPAGCRRLPAWTRTSRGPAARQEVAASSGTAASACPVAPATPTAARGGRRPDARIGSRRLALARSRSAGGVAPASRDAGTRPPRFAGSASPARRTMHRPSRSSSSSSSSRQRTRVR